MLPGVPRHPRDVLDVVELGDLRRTGESEMLFFFSFLRERKKKKTKRKKEKLALIAVLCRYTAWQLNAKQLCVLGI